MRLMNVRMRSTAPASSTTERAISATTIAILTTDELALTLGRDLRASRDHYLHGQYEEARFFLTGSLQSCVSCHTRLPDATNVPFTEELTQEARVQSLDLREQACVIEGLSVGVVRRGT